ncbi:uncharacterized protein LOC127750849 [Frankliniella occidentalis]|uniref:Uncharacterized protein LOC127750849 n=1 Tax=Frankliniella occidentalis TaxID=133901 RepID=A0A9C6XSE9_FRAOC|nr:uncharacterized protein LOC127750849 [Frankliniella occidentalis]
MHVTSTMHRNNKKMGVYLGALLRLLVPERVLAMPHLSARGMLLPGKIGLPKPIYEAVKVYMEHRGLHPQNGFANGINVIMGSCRQKIAQERNAARDNKASERMTSWLRRPENQGVVQQQGEANHHQIQFPAQPDPAGVDQESSFSTLVSASINMEQ